MVQIFMERLLRIFLWSQRGQNRVQWVSWKKVTRPIREGGLGIRRFVDTLYGLHGKLAWRIMEGKSLWWRMLLAKYGVIDGNIQIRQSSSRLWKVLFPAFWEIWKERCRIRFEDATRNHTTLIRKIYTIIYMRSISQSLQNGPRRTGREQSSTPCKSL